MAAIEMQPAVALRSNARPLNLQSLPPASRPLVRAYLLGYASAVAPRLLTLVLQFVSKKRRNAKKYLPADQDERSFLDSAIRILRTGLELQRFPAFCAALVGGSTLLQGPLYRLINSAAKSLDQAWRLRLARWLSTFIAGWFSLQLLQSKKISKPSETTSENGAKSEAAPKRFAGRTLDLTLFAVTRALDVLVGELWDQRRTRRKAAQKWTGVEQFLTGMTDPLVFAASSGLIMWAWFYSPDRLPASYNKWITSAASVDQRLLEALRRCKRGELQYGKETGQAALLGPMCTDYKLPYEWGDPAKSIPFPCELVHMGSGSSCEVHAVRRFFRSWKWSMSTYLPLTLGLQLRKPSKMNPIKAFVSASRSSTFLALFITLFYYGVCLGRNRLGPRLLGKDVACRQRIDGGICVGTGCLLCGWSVLVETIGRRKDMALFVAPRALATLVPRRYPVEQQWREKMVFAASTAVVFTCVLENPKRVRGVLGGILGMVIRN
ncbi:hypothetical protein PT974_02446 [Cladobotryum mycophilum]|uniref:Integral membrane protein n=1 Tax=Cladobotryum mycophilum TaxID=491253 RepID=A0ABR0SY48_9HYPO